MIYHISGEGQSGGPGTSRLGANGEREACRKNL
jgi:hypothetical protein